MAEPSLDSIQRAVDALVAELDVEQLSVETCRRAAPLFATIRAQAEAALVLVSARIADADGADGDTVGWLAGLTGQTNGEAAGLLGTGLAARGNDEVRSAFQRGELSSGTAKAIGAAAAEDPTLAPKLLDKAREASAEDVRRAAHEARRRASPLTDEEREARLHERRSLRTRLDEDGGTSGRFSCTNRQWAPVDATLDVYTQAVRNRCTRTGERSSNAAKRLDALALLSHIGVGGDPVDLGFVLDDLPAALRRLFTTTDAGVTIRPDTADMPDPADKPVPADTEHAEGAAPADHSTPAAPARSGRPARSSGISRKVIVRVDASALRRGWVEGEEVCDIAGVGPIPLAHAREVLGAAFVTLLVTDGTDVLTVAHASRGASAKQRTALEWLADACCSRGCTHPGRREIDHDDRWADTHHTWAPGLRNPCSHCHHLKTHKGYDWVGEPDAFAKQRFVPPDHPEHRNQTGAAKPKPTMVVPKRARSTRTLVGSSP